jgi:hypothetical protein
MEWGVKENHVAVTALHNCGKSYSQIFELLKPLKILRMFIYRSIKCYEELWRVEDRAESGCVKSLRAQAVIKTVQEWISQNPLWKQKIMSRKLNISTRSILRLIMDDQHDSAPPLKGTHPYSCLEGDLMDKSRESPPVACRERAQKHPLHRQENLHHREAVQPPEQDLCSNIP